MSTRPETAYGPTRPSQRTDDATDFSSSDTDATTSTGDATATTADRPETTDEETSWVGQCSRQFSTTSTERLRNLADDANHAMYDGV